MLMRLMYIRLETTDEAKEEKMRRQYVEIQQDTNIYIDIIYIKSNGHIYDYWIGSIYDNYTTTYYTV